METYYECIPCFLKQAQKSLKNVDETQHQKIFDGIGNTLENIDYKDSPPEIARAIFDVIDSYTGGIDLYVDAKKDSNLYILELYDELREILESSDDKFLTALKMAIAGNIIDFGAKHDFHDELIHDEIDAVLKSDLCNQETEELRKSIEESEKILYLGDNAGEIVFDKLFLEQLPVEKITFAVRGKPVINDALMEDAEMVGLTGIVNVISNGGGVPGTVLDRCSEEFRDIFEKSDLIISKG